MASPRMPSKTGIRCTYHSSARPRLSAQLHKLLMQFAAFLFKLLKINGGQGRIRTFVPRKEGQIYSLLALTTHPPVQKLSGEAAISLRPADRFCIRRLSTSNLQSKRSTANLNSQNRETKVAHKDHREDHCSLASTTRKSSEWSALEKPVRRLPNPPPAGQFYLRSEDRSLELAKGFEPPTC